MEVVMATLIVALVGTALLKTTSNNRLFIQRFEKINAQNQLLTFVAFDYSTTDTKESLVLINDDFFLDDLLLQRYDFIENDDVRKYFKKYKFHIKDEINTDVNFDELMSEFSENDSIDAGSSTMPKVKIIKTTMSNKDFQKSINKLRVEF